MDLCETLKQLYKLDADDIGSSKTILQTVRHALYEPRHASVIITHVNKLFSEFYTRDLGAELLVKILPDISDSVLEVNAVQWLNHAIDYRKSGELNGRRFRLIAKLISRCTKVQDFHKNVVSALSKIVDCCINVHVRSDNALYSLYCLSTCLRYYPSTCITFKKRVEDYLDQFLDIPQGSAISELTGTCMVLLNQSTNVTK